MLEVGWSELLVIAIVLIVVVGPKDLPRMLRTFATFTRKARGMASEFQNQFNDAMREADLQDLRKSIEDVRGLNPRNAIRDALDPLRKAGEDVRQELNKAEAGIKAAAETPPPPPAPIVTVPESPVTLPAAPPVLAAEPSAVEASSAKPKRAPAKRSQGKSKAAAEAKLAAKSAPKTKVKPA